MGLFKALNLIKSGIEHSSLGSRVIQAVKPFQEANHQFARYSLDAFEKGADVLEKTPLFQQMQGTASTVLERLNDVGASPVAKELREFIPNVAEGAHNLSSPWINSVTTAMHGIQQLGPNVSVETIARMLHHLG